MKRITMMVLVLCCSVMIAQDISGTYRATAQHVTYHFYTRPNVHLPSADGAGGTVLTIHDTYGLGVVQEVAAIPAGYFFGSNIVGPIGIPEMDALGYELFVEFNDDNSGGIVNSQVLASDTDEDACLTEITLLPLDDDLTYSSTLDAGATIQSNMVTSQANPSIEVNAFNMCVYAQMTYNGLDQATAIAGCAAAGVQQGTGAGFTNSGTWSVSGSSFFSFFPEEPTYVTADFQLYGDEFAYCYAMCLEATGGDHAYCGGVECAPYVHGYPGAPHPYPTQGYIYGADQLGVPALTSFSPTNIAYGLTPTYYLEWHYIDGPVAETGLGDIVGEDEDGDGSDYDNILGRPTLTATYMSPACGFNAPILGDVSETFEALGMGACVESVDEATEFYLMDASLAPWGNFLTYNAVLYSLTGDPTYAATDDSGYDMTDLTFIDADGDGVPDTPYSANGGRLLMGYDPTCIPVVTAITVLGELTQISCGNSGDANLDDNLDVLDVVSIVNHVLGISPLDVAAQCEADYNTDGGIDVLDVVSIVQTILGGRDDGATNASFMKEHDRVVLESDGYVGAVQMTLSHGPDVTFELGDAFVAKQHTTGTTTELMIVDPRSEVLFTATGDFSIEKELATNTEEYIDSQVVLPTAIALGNAYPNPFNPSTSFSLNVANAGNVSVMVYNVNGRLVDVLHEGHMNSGPHNFTWSAGNVASGMYIVKATTAGISVSEKVMLIK